MVCASQYGRVLPPGDVAGKNVGSRTRKRGMSTHEVQMSRTCIGRGPSVDVATWRRCRLLEAGFPPELAQWLAAADVDVHALLQLVDRGCDPHLAARILSPLGVDAEQW